MITKNAATALGGLYESLWPATMGLVPFWQPSTLCCSSQFPELYCCIVENKPFSLPVNVWIDTFSVSTQTQPVTYFRARLVGDCSTPQVRCICSLVNSRQWNAASWRRPVINPIQVSPNYQNGHRGTPFRQIIINSFPSRTEYEPYIRRCL